MVGASPVDCFKRFRKHVAGLVSKTLTTRYPLGRITAGGVMVLSFREGQDAIPIPLETKYGRLYFYMAQALEAKRRPDRSYHLTTLQYWYRLQEGPRADARAKLRWDYRRADPAKESYPRHHAHADVRMDLGTATLDLDKVHVPTGWATIEEIIRFLIWELGHKPPCGKDWPRVLKESEDAFYEEFTGKVRSDKRSS